MDLERASLKKARALHEAGRFDQAAQEYRRVLSLNPRNADALSFLGAILCQGGKLADGLGHLDTSLKIAPRQVYALVKRGNVLRELDRHGEALTSYDAALAINSRSAEAHNGRGIALKELKRYREAIASYDKVLALHPNSAVAYYNRGNALSDLTRFRDALADYERALELEPNFAAAHNNRGIALKELRHYRHAVASYDQALVLQPNFVEAHNNRGYALAELGLLEEAVASYDGALVLAPGASEIHINRGIALKGLKRDQDALASFRRALGLNPDADYVWGYFLHMKMRLCDWNGIDADFATVLRMVEDGKTVTEPFALLAMPSTPSDQLRAARTYVAHRSPPSPTPLWSGKGYDHKRLRLGYLSADFCDHPTAHLIAGLLECHDRAAFEVVGFSWGGSAEGAMRRRLETGLDRLIDVHAMSDREIAKRVRDMEIDIAIDLMGHTKDARMGIFAYRPAPVQVGYLGYPGTTGSAHIDYLIADATVVPEEHRKFYSEKIVTLPHSYQPNDRQRAISERKFTRAELGLPEQGFVFCCFNSNYKITPDVFDIWMRLLHAVEGSVLWLLEDNPGAATNLAKQAEERGVSPERLVFAKKLALPEHLARHRAADLFLDTFYCNAHTTASDALWAGLPIVTRLGETFAGRVAASVLGAAGLPDLVTESAEAYEALALELAADVARLTALKERLHNYRDTCPLFDTALTTRQIETAFHLMSERQRAKLAPDHIRIGQHGDP